MTVGTLAQLIELEVSQFGLHEHPPGSNKNPYSKAEGRPPEFWCMDFQVWAFRKKHIILPSYSASTRVVATAFNKEGRYHLTSPKPGDLAFCGYYNGINNIEHVGLVRSVNASRVYCNTIDANTTIPNAPRGSERDGLGVAPKVRHWGGRLDGTFHIIGFGRPEYAVRKPYKAPAGYAGSLIRTIKKGCHGRDVKRVQKLVGVHQDGDFGANTLSAVKSWQHHHNLTADGEFGPRCCVKAHWKWNG